jgi:hypothetical protein
MCHSSHVQPYLRTTQNNQFGANAVMSFANGATGYTRLELQGTSQTLAGIQGTTGSGVIQDRESGTGTNSVLTINNTGDYSYNGFLRHRQRHPGLDQLRSGHPDAQRHQHQL